MIASSLEHVKVAGIAAALPTHKVHSRDYGGVFGEKTVEKLIAATGVRECYHAHEKQTASDLAFSAAEHLLAEKNIDAGSIGVLLFATTSADYLTPSSSMVLHKRLKASQDCIVYDIDLGCSGFVYGLQAAASLLRTTTAERALLLVGDTGSKIVSPYDTSRILFGDAGAVALLERTEEDVPPMRFGLKSDGERFKAIIIPAGGLRDRDAPHEYVMWPDGLRRTGYHFYMDGMETFNFTMRDVPRLFEEFTGYFRISHEDVDALVLHQPNAFILKHLAKRLGVPLEKVPLTIGHYGNTGSASIPVTICDAFGGKQGVKRLMLSGFGIGLSWGVASLELDLNAVLPVIHTDDYYKDGIVSHDR